MAFLNIEDMTGEAEAIVFADTLASFGNALRKGRAIFMRAKLSYKDDSPKLIADKLIPAEKYPSYHKDMKLFIRLGSNEDKKMKDILSLCGKYPGGTKVILYLHDIKRQISPKNISGVRICDELAKEICKIAGEENAAMK